MSKLIAGMIEPTSGAILIDGIDVRQIDNADVRKNIGVMLQDSWLFSGTIRENIHIALQRDPTFDHTNVSYPDSPSTEDIIAEAEKLYKFVQTK